MATNKYDNGVAASGTSVVLNAVEMSGKVWYIDSENGTDDAGWGTDYEKPLATLAQAQTNASDDDWVIAKNGHNELLTAVLALTKRLRIIGEGGATGAPTVSFGLDNAANASLFTSSVISVSFENILFLTNAQTNTAARLSMTGGALYMENCYFQCSGTDEGAALSLGSGADNASLRGVYFVSTATSIADQPESGLKVAAAIANLELNGCVFDDGTVGFSSGFALHASTAAITRLGGRENSFLRGASRTIHASTTGHLGVGTKSGSGRALW